MKIRRFVAKDMRTALTQIKEELGVDAVIMSNKKIPEGVELMAAVDYSHSVPDAIAQTASENISQPEPFSNTSPQENVNPREITSDVVNIKTVNTLSPQENKPADSLSALLNRQVQQSESSTQATNKNNEQTSSAESSIEQQLKSFTDRLQNSNNESQQSVSSSPSFNAENNMGFNETNNNAGFANNEENNAVNLHEFENMQKEMASIRQLLEHQVSGLMWQDMAQKDPNRAVLINKLMALGINEQIADQIAGYVPTQSQESEAWQQAAHLISQQINTTNNDIIHRGGVVALVGPTGVGKTTTIAKLAARFAQVHGADQVALISTDTYRIGGFEQLSTYGKIIGCQVKLAKDAQSLDSLIQQFSQKKLILIDTAGMGQRDMRLAEHLTTLISNARVRIRNYLVLAANTQQQVMQENVERFKKVPLSGCIYTKLDESVSIGEIITTSIQNGLPIGYLTDGQRVPEDIKVANAEKLVSLAEKMSSKSASKNSAAYKVMPIAPSAVV